MAEMEKGQSDTESGGCKPENCRRKSNKEDNPPGTTDGSGSTMEAGPFIYHGQVSRNNIVERSGRQRPRPQRSVPYHLKDSRQRPQSSFSVVDTIPSNFSLHRLSRDAFVPGSGIDDLELTGVTNSPTGEAIKAVCPPTAPVGGAAPPRLDPI